MSSQSLKADVCGEACEVYSRVTGYHRPLKNWNEGKQQEFSDRTVYSIEKESDNLPLKFSPVSPELKAKIKSYLNV